MDQLIQDLVNAFNEDWKGGHNPENVAAYNTYYMGSLVLCQKGGTYSIIDRQTLQEMRKETVLRESAEIKDGRRGRQTED